MWITNGTTDGTNTGDAFLVYARTGPGRQDVSMFIVEKVMTTKTTSLLAAGTTVVSCFPECSTSTRLVRPNVFAGASAH